MFKDYLTSFTVFLEILKKKKGKTALKKSSEKKALKMTSQLVIFRAFLFLFFRPDPRSERKSQKSTNNKNSGLGMDVSCSEKLVLCCLKCALGSLNKYKK